MVVKKLLFKIIKLNPLKNISNIKLTNKILICGGVTSYITSILYLTNYIIHKFEIVTTNLPESYNLTI